MSVALLGLLCVALLLMAAALWLWQGASQRQRRQATTAFVEEQLHRAEPEPQLAESPQLSYSTAPGRPRGIAGRLQNLLLRAGVDPDARFCVPWLVALVGLPVCALLFGGGLAAAAMLILVVLALAFLLWWKAARRREAMVRQLPNFLDTLVRLVTIGNSLGSAFHSAVGTVDQPLFEVLERANQLNRAGMELDAAIAQAGRLYRVKEIELVAAVIGVSLRFGGRSDQVLERMAGFMRDLQQSREELHALSAEVRLSAWILALLPVSVGGFIVVFNNALFISMWTDQVGRQMLVAAFFLQVAGGFWLYRLAKSV